tara:strand:- start:1559 stop:1939 length:381 start_codon:yes stop_codon:yes gene_type:complete
MKLDKGQKSFLKKVIPGTAIVAGLCCFTPVVLVFFGLSSVAFAASLADTLYGQNKWWFRAAGLLFLSLALYWYIYKKEKVCTLDDFKRKKRKILNMVLITLISGVLAYIVWLYVIVEWMGKALGIW